MMATRTFAMALAAAAWSAAAAAQTPTTPDPATHHPPSASAPAALDAEGEVRKVDKEQGKLTLKHGRLDKLDMPPMTMVFKVADPKMLEGLKAGDKVKFAADRLNGAITVTAIQIAQ